MDDYLHRKVTVQSDDLHPVTKNQCIFVERQPDMMVFTQQQEKNIKNNIFLVVFFSVSKCMQQ